MTTAQLASKIRLEPYRNCPGQGVGAAGVNPAGARTRVKPPGRSLDRLLLAVVKRMERSDTLADKAAGYGLCGVAMAYLTAHVVKALFG
ncbi:MAG: hypothetical protein K6T65_09970 [Peptococcaceae bacterium]|nr:hypothetical protein [Peptococcaceae bacterium]